MSDEFSSEIHADGAMTAFRRGLQVGALASARLAELAAEAHRDLTAGGGFSRAARTTKEGD